MNSGSPIINVLSLLREAKIDYKKDHRVLVQAQKKEKLTYKQRLYLISYLLKFQKDDGKLQTGAIQNAAGIYSNCTSTIYKIWKRYSDTCDEYGLGGDYQRNYTNIGQKQDEHLDLL